MNVGIIGLGIVGSACESGFSLIPNCEIYGHDKYKSSYSLETVVENCKLIFICLPTPMDFETGECDLSIIEEVCANINKIAEKRKLIIIKSTVAPGTTQSFANKYKRHSWWFNPEFLTEANFINDFLNQDRIIIGSTVKGNTEFLNHQADLEYLIKFYQEFTKTQKSPAKIVVSKSQEAEMCKYIANSFLATKLSFLNEIYDICEKSDINYNKTIELVKLDKRLGNSHWQVPGDDLQRGFSKSCLPKDLNSLMFFARSLGVDPIVMDSVWTKNLLVREDHDWEKLSQVTGKYKKGS